MQNVIIQLLVLISYRPNLVQIWEDTQLSTSYIFRHQLVKVKIPITGSRQSRMLFRYVDLLESKPRLHIWSISKQ